MAFECANKLNVTTRHIFKNKVKYNKNKQIILTLKAKMKKQPIGGTEMRTITFQLFRIFF